MLFEVIIEKISKNIRETFDHKLDFCGGTYTFVSPFPQKGSIIK